MKTLIKCPRCQTELPFREEATRPGGQTCGSCGHGFRLNLPLPAAIQPKERIEKFHPELAAMLKPGQPFYDEPYCHRVDRSEYVMLAFVYVLLGIIAVFVMSTAPLPLAVNFMLCAGAFSWLLVAAAVHRYVRGARTKYYFTPECLEITAGIFRTHARRIPIETLRDVRAGWMAGDRVGNLIVDTSDPIHPTHVLRGCIRPMTLMKLINAARSLRAEAVSSQASTSEGPARMRHTFT